MIFETLWDSAERGELILIDGGFCHWHLCKRDDPKRNIEAGQITIREIISTRPGAGTEMLETLKRVPGARSLFARCPVDLVSNEWYRRRGFTLEGQETTQTGRQLNLWRLTLDLGHDLHRRCARRAVHCCLVHPAANFRIGRAGDAGFWGNFYRSRLRSPVGPVTSLPDDCRRHPGFDGPVPGRARGLAHYRSLSGRYRPIGNGRYRSLPEVAGSPLAGTGSWLKLGQHPARFGGVQCRCVRRGLCLVRAGGHRVW